MSRSSFTRARRTIPPGLPCFCSDVPDHWPGGKLPVLRPWPIDPDVTPLAASRGPPCPYEAALDAMPAAAAERIGQISDEPDADLERRLAVVRRASPTEFVLLPRGRKRA